MLLPTLAAALQRRGAPFGIAAAALWLPIVPMACAHGIDLDLEPLPGESGTAGTGTGPSMVVGGTGGLAGSSTVTGSGGRGDAQGVGGAGAPTSTSSAGGAGAGGNTGGSGLAGSGSGGMAGSPGTAGSGGDAGSASGGASGASSDGGAGRGGMSGAAGQGGSGGVGGMGGAAGSIVLVDAGPPVTVDDSVVGTGTNQFNYVGGWGHCNPCTTATTPPLYNSTNSWADGGDAGERESATFAFIGQQISFYGVQDPRNGIGGVSIDGGAETQVDFYAVTRAGNRLLWKSPVLVRGAHSFRLRTTGTKNASSTGVTVVVDRVDVQ